MSNPYKQHFKKMKQNSKPKMPSRPKRSLPYVSMAGAALMLVACTWLYLNIEKIENLISKVEIHFLGSAVASDKQQNLPSNSNEQEKKSLDATNVQTEKKDVGRSLSDEELALFNKLDDRKKSLDEREAELKKLEAELQQQKLALEEKMKQLEELRNKIAVQLDDRVKTDASRVDKLVQMYSNMKPQRAAKILETVNEDLAVEILKSMKKDRAAEILNMVEASKAQKLSEKFAGYRRD